MYQNHWRLPDPEYFAVKEEQAFVKGRITELMPKLAQAEEIEPDESTSRAHVGSTVVVQEDGGAPETYTIIDAVEVNPKEGQISNESPMGQALLGRRVGDEATVEAPVGVLQFHILRVT